MKLIKRDKLGTGAETKSIEVEDDKGNKHLLRATVVSINKAESSKIQDDEQKGFGVDSKIVVPPLPLEELAILGEYSTELDQIIDIFSVGVSGFGGRLEQRSIPEDKQKAFQRDVDDEYNFLNGFFDCPNPDESFVDIRVTTRNFLEKTGNAYWELVPGFVNEKRYSCINVIESQPIRITVPDSEFTKMSRNVLRNDFIITQKFFQKKFRRFVQIVNNKKVYFKEFGDPRVIDRRTGEVAGEKLPKKWWANELFHFKLGSTRKTPYGLPRYVGNIISIKGSRQADEANLVTLMNNNIPSFAVLANGVMLTEGSITRIREFVEAQIAGSSNYSKWLLLEGESTHDGLSTPGSSKIEIVPLTQAQHSDMLFQSYDENNAKKLRRNFRMPPILVGASENYDRATAQVSERLTERYVFNPARESEDRGINRIVLEQGIRFWTFKSNSPNVTNDQDIVSILTGGERSGSLTPRIGRMMLEDVLNRKLPGFENMPPEFNPDVPFSFTLAKITSGMAKANQMGTAAPQGQIPSAESAVDAMLKVLGVEGQELKPAADALRAELDKEYFGEANYEYRDQ